MRDRTRKVREESCSRFSRRVKKLRWRKLQARWGGEGRGGGQEGDGGRGGVQVGAGGKAVEVVYEGELLAVKSHVREAEEQLSDLQTRA